MSIASGFRFVGIAPGVDLKERKSKVLNSQTEPFTLDEIRGYKVFTGLVTQSGVATESSINSGELTIGVTYSINQDSPGMDFTNVGAPNNNLTTSFIATGKIPNSWGIGADYTLAYSEGAPIVTILENTIGNIWFSYDDVGQYNMNSNGLFTVDKTHYSVLVTNDAVTLNKNALFALNSNIINITSGSEETLFNDLLFNTPIEIRVYS